MSDVVSVAPPTTHPRQTKFTPANIRQIANLLERGKSKDEIAEIIGVTPASLQVTCSKLGISLRRPHVGGVVSGIRRPRPQNGTSSKEVVRERQQVQETPHVNGAQSSQDSGRELNDQERDKHTHAAIEAKPQAVVGLRPEPRPVKHADACRAGSFVLTSG